MRWTHRVQLKGRVTTCNQTQNGQTHTGHHGEQKYRHTPHCDENRQEYAYLPDQYNHKQPSTESINPAHHGYQFGPSSTPKKHDSHPNNSRSKQQLRPKRDNREQQDSSRLTRPPPTEDFCISCMTYGHTDIECTKTGAHVSIEEYHRQCPKERKQEILQAYQQNQKEAHERYKAAY